MMSFNNPAHVKKTNSQERFLGLSLKLWKLRIGGLLSDVQNKLRRVINVWRERGVFEFAVLGDIEQKLEGSFRIKEKVVTV